jgi:hypothetical protein
MRLLLKERGKGVSGKTPTTPDIWAALPAEWGSASGTDLIGSIVNASAGDVKYSNHEKHKGKKNLMPTDYETCSGNNAKSFFPSRTTRFFSRNSARISFAPSAICQAFAPAPRDLSGRGPANPSYHCSY